MEDTEGLRKGTVSSLQTLPHWTMYSGSRNPTWIWFSDSAYPKMEFRQRIMDTMLRLGAYFLLFQFLVYLFQCFHSFLLKLFKFFSGVWLEGRSCVCVKCQYQTLIVKGINQWEGQVCCSSFQESPFALGWDCGSVS